jgi:membrane associated rhomboid family serine protease
VNGEPRRAGGPLALLEDLAAHPVSGGTVLAAVALHVATALGASLDHLVLAGDRNLFGEPWRAVTTALLHGGWLHLAFNVAWTWTLGRRVEAVFGSLATLFSFLLLAAVPLAAEYALFEGGVGLSGVGYGLVGMLWVLARRDARFVGALDDRLAGLFAAWFFVCIGLSWSGVLAVANVAHGAGAVLGVLLGLSVVAERSVLARAAATGLTLAALVGATLAREWVNLSGGAERAAFQRAIEALREDDLERALEAGRRAVSVREDFPEAWYNLGVTYLRLGRRQEALEAFERALALDPGDPLYEGAARNLRD